MTRPTSLILVFIAAFALTSLMVMGCKSTSKANESEERIAAFEVKLTTATNEIAEAFAELALIVEYKGLPQPSRQSHQLGKVRYDTGVTKAIKVKTTEMIPWKNRNQITFYISTQSQDGYLPSNVWIAAVSNKGNRFTMRDASWKHSMLSVEPYDPEARVPSESTREWLISNEN